MANGKSTKQRHPAIKKGDTFGRWVATEDETVAVMPNGRKRKRVLCRCSCSLGIEKMVDRDHLLAGVSESCGCVRKESAKKRFTTHGCSKALEYRVWSGIKSRCLNPNSDKYADYGGRGITMCKRWQDSFEAFMEDMGPRANPSMEVERLDNNKGYEKSNCAWKTRKEQMSNTRKSVHLTCNGVTKCLSAWAEETGLSSGTIAHRKALGWSDEDAILTPANVVRRRSSRNTLLTLGNVTDCLAGWSERTGLLRVTIGGRLRKGWSVERALTTPLGPTSKAAGTGGIVNSATESARPQGTTPDAQLPR